MKVLYKQRSRKEDQALDMFPEPAFFNLVFAQALIEGCGLIVTMRGRTAEFSPTHDSLTKQAC